MGEIIPKYLLEGIFRSNFQNLKTGTDKITPYKFSTLKNDEFEIIQRKCLNRTYKFTRPKRIRANNRTVIIPTIRDFIVLEVLKKSIEQKLFISYPDRDKIIRLIQKKLRSKQNLYIIRLDIKSFFSSIPHNFLLEKLKKRYSLTKTEYYLIKEYLSFEGNKGVPTGISLSNVLSEFYLKELDERLQSIHPRIGNYFRYVDDILIIVNGVIEDFHEIASLKNSIMEHFSSFGLRLNVKKHKGVNFNFDNTRHEEFEYLGYKFKKRGLSTITLLGEKKEVEVKGKIKFIFNEYANDQNLELLFERLNYITRTNTMITSSIKINRRNRTYTKKNLIYHGVVESYKRVDDLVWKNLDKYLQGNIYANFGGQLTNQELKNNLFRNSFLTAKKMKYLNKFHLRGNEFFVEKILALGNTFTEEELQRQDRNMLEKKYREVLSI